MLIVLMMLGIIQLAPLSASLWVWLARKNLDPFTPMKFALALIVLGAGLLVITLVPTHSRNGPRATNLCRQDQGKQVLTAYDSCFLLLSKPKLFPPFLCQRNMQLIRVVPMIMLDFARILVRFIVDPALCHQIPLV